MQRIDAVIRPHQLDAVKDSLTRAGVSGITVAEVQGLGHNSAHTGRYRGVEYTVDFAPQIQLTVVAAEDRVGRIVDAIVAGAGTGRAGDGKIFVTPLSEVIRIRTGERGAAAI